MPENKICPDCHTINSPNAVKCECGHRFEAGDSMTEKEYMRAARRRKLRAALIALPIVILLLGLSLLNFSSGFRIILRAILIIFVIVAVVLLLSKAKSDSDRKKMK